MRVGGVASPGRGRKSGPRPRRDLVVIDVVSIVPFGEIQKGSGSGDSVKLVRLIKLLRLLKMARVIKLKRFLAAYWSHFHITYQTVPKPNLQPDFNVSVFECVDTSSSAGLRELDESDRSFQKSAESTSI